MEVLVENIVVYSLAAVLFVALVYFFVRHEKKKSNLVAEKIRTAREEGLHEPFSLHPLVDVKSCIQTGACISACPEKDILGILNGKATTINASHCVGHGACFHACPTRAITLCIGTEQRGVDIPHIDQTFESNVPGIYIAGEMGGMGLIRNAVEQGRQAVENLSRRIDKNIPADFDLLIVGAGPAGISASLAAKKLGLSTVTLEQDSLGGTVFTFPRAKIVMTSPMDLPLYGKVKLNETSKTRLLELWQEVLGKNGIEIRENVKVEQVIPDGNCFRVRTSDQREITSRKVLLAIGRRGSPRKLNIPGENSTKVAYRLLEPELVAGKRVVVVGGGDSAVESALLLAGENQVTLSYRGEAFGRLKPANNRKIQEAAAIGQVKVMLNTNLTSIAEENVSIVNSVSGENHFLENDLVYIFAGGELPTRFLEKAGIRITRRFGEALLKHE